MFGSIILLFALLIAATASSIVDSTSKERMANGNHVSLGSVPFMASLRALNVHFCGGSIVSNQFVLTSARCTHQRVVNTIAIIVGSNIRGAGGLTYQSNRITAHPGFNPETLSNDISLVGTAATILMTHNIAVANINALLSDDELSVAISGWGMVSDLEYDPNALHSITTKSISNIDCLSNQNLEYPGRITDNKICTDALINTGICYGDEGGAIFSGNELIGVASWHSYCEPGVPNVYERLAPHRLWILSNL